MHHVRIEKMLNKNHVLGKRTILDPIFYSGQKSEVKHSLLIKCFVHFDSKEWNHNKNKQHFSVAKDQLSYLFYINFYNMLWLRWQFVRQIIINT